VKKQGAIFLWAILLALPCAANADPVLGVPVTPTTNQGPPIVINECRLVTSGSQWVTTSSGIQIQFTNETTKTAQLINFQVNDVYQNAVIRDVGTFSPGITVIHKYKIGEGETYSPLFDAPNLHCAVSSIKFDDGSVWHSDQPPLPVNSPVPVSINGGFLVYPNRLFFNSTDPRHDLFFIAQGDAAGSIAQVNSCGKIAQVTGIAYSAYASVFRVTPAQQGSCTITVRDKTNRMVVLNVLVSRPL
jgi:hypothetical protein